MVPGDRNPNRYRKHALSVAMLALIAAGANKEAILDHMLAEKEREVLTAYFDSAHVLTICKGLTHIPPVGGPPVRKGMQLTKEQCAEYDRQMEAQDFKDAESIIKPQVWAGLSEAAKAGVADFVHNLGKSKAKDSTFIRELNAGHRNNACAAITLWIKDNLRDCRKAGSNCQGQPIRRMQEDELCLIGENQ